MKLGLEGKDLEFTRPYGVFLRTEARGLLGAGVDRGLSAKGIIL